MVSTDASPEPLPPTAHLIDDACAAEPDKARGLVSIGWQHPIGGGWAVTTPGQAGPPCNLTQIHLSERHRCRPRMPRSERAWLSSVSFGVVLFINYCQIHEVQMDKVTRCAEYRS